MPYKKFEDTHELCDDRSTLAAVMRWALAGVSGVSSLLLIYVVWNSRLLRPIADDYCLAAEAGDGLIPGIVSWWSNWSGDLTMVTSNTVLVGLPLIHFPWFVASALPFLLTVATATSLGIYVTLHSLRLVAGRQRGLKVALAISPILAIVWWSYWWAPALLAPDSADNYPLALGITVWQNLNAQYVVTSFLLIGGWLWIESRPNLAMPWRPMAYALLGLGTGFNGPVFAVSALIMVLSLAALSALRGISTLRERGPYWGLAVVVAGVSAGISHFSPGSQNRKGQLADPDLNFDLIYLLVTEAIPSGISSWWFAVFNSGALIVLVVSAFVGVALASQGIRPERDSLFSIGFGLLGFSMIMFILNGLSEYFSYHAWWHLTAPRSVTWISLIAIGVALGNLASNYPQLYTALPIIFSAAIAALLLTLSANAVMVSTMQSRWWMWERGPAPMSDIIGDIEDPEGFQYACWRELTIERTAPSRDSS